MPLTAKGEKIKGAMEEEYGAKKGEEVFYASANKGTITGVHDEQWNVGDKVHLGFGTKGGAGFYGVITEIGGASVTIRNPEGKTYKGPTSRLSRGDDNACMDAVEATARLGQICDSIGHLCSRFDAFLRGKGRVDVSEDCTEEADGWWCWTWNREGTRKIRVWIPKGDVR